MIDTLKRILENHGYETMRIGDELYVFKRNEFLDCLTIDETWDNGRHATLRSYVDDITLEVWQHNERFESVLDHLRHRLEWLGCDLVLVKVE